MYPRANTLGLLIKDHHILLEEQNGKHSRGNGYFYRPIGGTIELGEKSEEALVREYVEEIGVEIRIKRYVTCIENIYKIDGKTGHEITQLYIVDFNNKQLYQKDSFTVTEGTKVTVAKWISMDEFFEGKLILYPEGLIKILKEECSL